MNNKHVFLFWWISELYCFLSRKKKKHNLLKILLFFPIATVSSFLCLITVLPRFLFSFFPNIVILIPYHHSHYYPVICFSKDFPFFVSFFIFQCSQSLYLTYADCCLCFSFGNIFFGVAHHLHFHFAIELKGAFSKTWHLFNSTSMAF